ncbi:pyridoxine 5'-phosphate synthase [Benzoatithermus flavus]|uniref:Pyridoxine 5'-phosphate synthase n=1 Tax=Benzoatithermus flavus TaxID=3108223 RepID=A0ABU8XTJ7_9PROT
MSIAAPPLRLGVNLDHVATLRNARGGAHPDPVRFARLALEAGADSITVHLREDRRHIRDADVERLMAEIRAPLNLEMAVTEEMVGIARRLRPHATCLVPERRQEVTTEGGLDVRGAGSALRDAVAALGEAGCRVSLFVDPEPAQLDAAAAVGAPVVELHTGAYCEARAGEAQGRELARLRAAARHAAAIGLECHAGHGLSYADVRPVAAIPEIVELNIGHFIVGEALAVGLVEAIRRMRAVMEAGRRDLARPHLPY